MKKFKYKINDNEYEVSVKELDTNIAEVKVNGTIYTVEIEKPVSISATASKPAGKVDPVTVPQKVGAPNPLKAPLPGTILKLLVSEGQAVKKGDVLLTMESMKMENNVVAEENGIVKSIKVSSGQNVMQDDLLIEFDGATAASPAAAPASAAPKASTGGKTISVKSPLPGSVFKVLVEIGQSVQAGTTLLVLESMKMENNINAEKAGIVKAIHVQPGHTVLQDDLLIELES